MSIHIVIPAGGSGSRFAAGQPKQFVPLHGRMVLEWTLLPFLQHPAVDTVWVALAPALPPGVEHALDRLAQAHPGRLRRLACAGATRALTVAAALDRVAAATPLDDPWILVHDAARPGITAAMLAPLLDALHDEPVGALLALPLADTLKSAHAATRAPTAHTEGVAGNAWPVRVAETRPRIGLWLAQTPQAFRLGLLRRALQAAGPEAGDEASAVEALGLQPRLIEGHPANLKLTRPGDGELIAAILAARRLSCG